MKNLKKAGYILFGIAALLSVVICLQKPAGSRKNEALFPETESLEEAVIHYYIWENEEAYVRPVIAAYESLHHNITIELHVVDADVLSKFV